MTISNNLILPSDTRCNLKELKGKIENYHLFLNKCVKFSKFDGEYEVKKELPEVKEGALSLPLQFVKKQKYVLESYRSRGYEVDVYEFRPYERVIVGLGQESIREVSMTLHWIYGIPYIPGQAVKGVVSNWIEMNGGTDENYEKVFGTTSSKGQVMFLDSYPADDSFCIKNDIMNPHYTDYYSKGREPADWCDPNLVLFLTVEKAVFHIPLVYLTREAKSLKISGKTLEEWMVEAFEYGGIGAKTSLGYGVGDIRLIGGR
ncbi:MAG: type III-B CRISPR module RAMP protein Cmr6 [Thermosediminibacteraceae bacterium]|nr:type III-B CRISPR module RAMP protein Cmr6 [Thermosediminibacteraceae bacterium]